MSRVDSVRLAIEKARDGVAGAVLASDAYFPFADGPELALEAGVTAIIQPGGSVRDPEVGRGGRPRRRRDGVHRPPPLPPLSSGGSIRACGGRSALAVRGARTASAAWSRAGRSCSSAAPPRSTEDGVVVGETPYEQAVEILRKIEHELSRAGASLADVIQTAST